MNTNAIGKALSRLVSAVLATVATAGIGLAVGYWAAIPNTTIVGSDLVGVPVLPAATTADGPA